ncbi:hypothetical protein KP509_15G069500 [Ceratopteris richardii]|uniref:Uncharacterized protein n=1 Tax=Ceratopteris richardii TaxID=49495 RepID=A0A8T2T9F4_CERRI|nr:hypothetical protein KP509_15G069500 [Ceratopteris richardii]
MWRRLASSYFRHPCSCSCCCCCCGRCCCWELLPFDPLHLPLLLLNTLL